MKNFVLEFTDNEWTLYHYDEELNNLPDIKGNEINKYFNLPDLSYLEDEYTSINANWDNIEAQGYIDIEITDPKSESTYSFNDKFDDFNKFIEAINNLKDEIETKKVNVSGWEYERKNQYKSRGLSIRDFI